MRTRNLGPTMIIMLSLTTAIAAAWPPAKSPAIPEADGYVAIPDAALAPDKAATYQAVFDATEDSDDPATLLPALNMVGSELNALAVAGVPLDRAKFVVLFHGPAMSGLLDEAHYKTRFGGSNPNLKVLAELKKAGVELYVCGQNLAAEKIDPATLSPDVRVAADALLALIAYQNKGYALLSF